MTRDSGLPRADLNTSLFDDPKVVSLARRIKDPARIMNHVGLYLALVLKSWRDGRRLTLDEAAPAWWLEGTEDQLVELIAVGLLDVEGRIPEPTFDEWFGPASRRYAQRREAGSKGGQATAVQRGSPPSTPPSATASVLTDSAGTTPDVLAQPSSQPANQPVPARVPARETAADGWEGFNSKWAGFRIAWTNRGFTRPPSEKQRVALWDVVDARPLTVGPWVADAPAGAKASEVVGYVLDRWHAAQAEANTEAEAEERLAADRKRADAI